MPELPFQSLNSDSEAAAELKFGSGDLPDVARSTLGVARGGGSAWLGGADAANGRIGPNTSAVGHRGGTDSSVSI